MAKRIYGKHTALVVGYDVRVHVTLYLYVAFLLKYHYLKSNLNTCLSIFVLPSPLFTHQFCLALIICFYVYMYVVYHLLAYYICEILHALVANKSLHVCSVL